MHKDDPRRFAGCALGFEQLAMHINAVGGFNNDLFRFNQGACGKIFRRSVGRESLPIRAIDTGNHGQEWLTRS